MAVPRSDSAVFNDYADALRVLAGPALDPEAELRVIQIEPRRGGFVVGFTSASADGNSQVFYVEPSRTSIPQNTALPHTTLPDGSPVIAWVYPADPRLPALQAAVFPEALGVLLERMGMSSQITHLELVGYRPGRRAVVKVDGDDETLFVKITRPDLVERIVDTHRRVARAGLPTPDIVQWSPAGLIVFREAQGQSMVDAAGHAAGPESVSHLVVQSIESLASVDLPYPARTPILENYGWYFDQAIAAYPASSSLIREIRQRVEALIEHSAPSGKVTVHGDLHAGQLFVSPYPTPHVSAMIDLDGAGQGYPGDDLATFFAHSIVTAERTTSSDDSIFWRAAADHVETATLTRFDDSRRWIATVVTNLMGHSLNLSSGSDDLGPGILDYCQAFLIERR